MNSGTTIKENCSNCEYNRQCFIKKQLGAVECQKDKDYITNLQQENKQLKVELQEANDNIIWWSNRFNAVERDNKQLKEDKMKAREWVKKNQYYFPKPTELLKILGDNND